MTVYFPWENKKIEEVKKKVMDVLPPMPQPPTPEETGEAWKKVITETPEYILPFAPKVDVKQLGKALVGTASSVASTPGLEFLQPLQIKGFHGSPYKFSKFKNKAIGTGEGAQAFGYGHYLTESPEVAKTYSMTKSVKLGDIEITPKSMWFDPLQRVIRGEQGWNESALAKSLQDTIDNWGINSRIGKESNSILEKMKAGEKPIPAGVTYETTIHKGKQPSEYTYLEWDKPIDASVAEKVNKIADEYGELAPYIKSQVKYYKEYPGARHGSNLYSILEKILGGEKQASEFLSRAGFSGIKYPTGSLSGVKGTGKYNYVVFNPEDITIESILPPGVEKK